MSKGAVSQVIQRAIGDAAFRRQLQGDPNKALAGFDLTTDERSAITSGDPGRLTALGVDQRMSKAYNLSGISAASKSAVSPDLTGAGAAAFVDEGGSAGRASSAIEAGGANANTANLRRIEGDLNVSAARESLESANAMNLRRIEGDLNVAASTTTEGTSALNTGASAYEGGTSTTSSAITGGSSANATNLRRIEGDLNVAAARQPVDVSGDFNRLDPGIETKASEATAFEPSGSGLDLGMIDPGYVSGGDAAARAADVANDAGANALRPNEVTE